MGFEHPDPLSPGVASDRAPYIVLSISLHWSSQVNPGSARCQLPPTWVITSTDRPSHQGQGVAEIFAQLQAPPFRLGAARPRGGIRLAEHATKACARSMRDIHADVQMAFI